MIELERSSILNALARVERRHRAPQHVGSDAKTTGTGQELEVNPGSRTERARPLDECAPRAQVDEGYRVARPKDRLRAGNGRLAESCVGPTIS
jgi:hypothetical protein